MNKRGSEKYYLVISIIIGIVVVGLGLYYLFGEYFGNDTINYETCRQSVVLRSGNVANGVKSIQENFPFKCKTEVVNIDFPVPNVSYVRLGLAKDNSFKISNLGGEDVYFRFYDDSSMNNGGEWEIYVIATGASFWSSIKPDEALTFSKYSSDFIVGELNKRTNGGFDKYAYIISILKDSNYENGKLEIVKIEVVQEVPNPDQAGYYNYNGKRVDRQDILIQQNGLKANISGIIANEMAKCWYLYGEGKQVFYSDNTFNPSSACFHCARITFSNRVKGYFAEISSFEQNENAGLVDLYSYLAYNKIDDSQYYTNYLYGSEKGWVPDFKTSKADSLGLNNVNFNGIDIVRGGDVFVTMVYQLAGFYNLKGKNRNVYQEVIAYQPANGMPNCQVTETLPA